MFRLKWSEQGFTLVEVMIVLVIGGIILLLVFLAIPALQRSTRNYQRRQDVALALQAVSHYELNDTGKFPNECGGLSQSCAVADPSVGPNDYFMQFDKDKLRYYTSDEIYIDVATKADINPSNDPNRVDIYNYEKCDPGGSGKAVVQGAGYNDVVALFAIDSGVGTNSECQQL